MHFGIFNRCLRGALLSVGAFWPAIVIGDVQVSAEFATKPNVIQAGLGSGKYKEFPLGIFKPGDRIIVTVSVTSNTSKEISAFIADEDNFRAWQRKEKIHATAQSRAATPFVLTHEVKLAAPYFLVLDNSFPNIGGKNVQASVQTTVHIDEAQIAGMQKKLESTYAWLKRLYEFPDFNIRVKPCGQVNAFSTRATGDITLCTELLSATAKSDGAFRGIFYHEMAHTLLNLWKLPGSSNEDVADEFAVQLLIRQLNGADKVAEFSSYFAGKNPWMEARNAIERGDKHALSVQRVRNISNAMINAKEITSRWNTLLYPHMTDKALTYYKAKPGPYGDSALAAEELKKRGKLATADPAPTLPQE